MSRRSLASLTVATALAATAAGASPAHAVPAIDPPVNADSPAPTQVTVTRPAGFDWADALLGAAVGGVLVAGVAGAGSLRRRARHVVQAPRPTTR